MKTIWKYTISIAGPNAIAMPTGARILPSPMINPDDSRFIDLWAEVNPSQPLTTRAIFFFGTGHPKHIDGRFLGTVRDEAALVWHVYEVTP